MDTSPELNRVQRDIAPSPAGDISTDGQLQDELHAAHADLRTAQADLQAARRKIESQRETIDRLVESHRELRLEQERTMAVLPVPVVVTDLEGNIRALNAAAALLAGRSAAHLLGRPMFDIFGQLDRGDVRGMLATRVDEGAVRRRAATLVPPTGEPVPVVVVASRNLLGSAEREISWVLLRRRDPDDVMIGLAEALVPIAGLPAKGGRLEEALPAAAAACGRALHPVAQVTVALGPPLKPTAVASTAMLAQAWDGAQLDAGEGPSVSAYAEDRLVETLQPGSDERWPTLAGRLPRGAGAAVAAPFSAGGRVAGVLSAYGCGPDAHIPTEAVEVLAVAIGGLVRAFELAAELARTEDDMKRALSTRAVIDQAKGIVMADRGIDADAAWEHLVHLSSTQHVKVREVAEAIVARAAGRA